MGHASAQRMRQLKALRAYSCHRRAGWHGPLHNILE